MKETKSIKVDLKVYRKVKRHAAKSKQTIGGIFELGAEAIIEDKVISEWKRKADKWDALGDKITKYYPDGEENDEFDSSDGLIGIGEAAATAYGFL